MLRLNIFPTSDWSYKNNPDLSYHQQKVIAVPDITNDIMYEGDTLLVCW